MPLPSPLTFSLSVDNEDNEYHMPLPLPSPPLHIDDMMITKMTCHCHHHCHHPLSLTVYQQGTWHDVMGMLSVTYSLSVVTRVSGTSCTLISTWSSSLHGDDALSEGSHVYIMVGVQVDSHILLNLLSLILVLVLQPWQGLLHTHIWLLCSQYSSLSVTVA